MTPVAKLGGLLLGAMLVGGIGGNAIYQEVRPKPRYYWYDVAQVDSLRDILNRVRPARLKLEERSRDHIYIVAVPVQADAQAAAVAGPMEVEESWPCPPNCLPLPR